MDIDQPVSWPATLTNRSHWSWLKTWQRRGRKGGKWARIFPRLKVASVFSLKAAKFVAKIAEDFLLQKWMLSQKRKQEFLIPHILLDCKQSYDCHSRSPVSQGELIKRDVMVKWQSLEPEGCLWVFESPSNNLWHFHIKWPCITCWYDRSSL